MAIGKWFNVPTVFCICLVDMKVSDYVQRATRNVFCMSVSGFTGWEI